MEDVTARKGASGTLGLPDFVILGAMKSGTTSLAEYLMAHPQAYLPPGKELSFFDRNWDRGVDWYRSQFSGRDGEVASGEATPTYLSSPRVPERLASVVPDAKLIAILRNPVDRAYSHYWHERHRKDRERRPFERAVFDELAAGINVPDDHFDPGHLEGVGYLARGRYVEHLEALAEHYPRSSLLVLLLEDLEADPRATFARVCRFIGIDPGYVPDNVGAVANAYVEQRARPLWRFLTRHRLWHRLPAPLGQRLANALVRVDATYEPMAPGLRGTLERHFEPWNARLADWLGRDLSVWQGAARAADPSARIAHSQVQWWHRR